MSIKEKIVLDLNDIAQPDLLHQIANYIATVKKKQKQPKHNIKVILSLTGSLSDSVATEMRQTIASEFNKIEGEW